MTDISVAVLCQDTVLGRSLAQVLGRDPDNVYTDWKRVSTANLDVLVLSVNCIPDPGGMGQLRSRLGNRVSLLVISFVPVHTVPGVGIVCLPLPFRAEDLRAKVKEARASAVDQSVLDDLYTTDFDWSHGVHLDWDDKLGQHIKQADFAGQLKTLNARPSGLQHLWAECETLRLSAEAHDSVGAAACFEIIRKDVLHPRKKDPAPVQAIPESVPLSRPDCYATVFIVDDDPAVLQALETLDKRGYEVRTFKTEMEAVDEIKANAPDVVVCDLLLDLDDREAGLRVMKVARTNPKILVMAMSGGEVSSGELPPGVINFCGRDNKGHADRLHRRLWELARPQ